MICPRCHKRSVYSYCGLDFDAYVCGRCHWVTMLDPDDALDRLKMKQLYDANYPKGNSDDIPRSKFAR